MNTATINILFTSPWQHEHMNSLSTCLQTRVASQAKDGGEEGKHAPAVVATDAPDTNCLNGLDVQDSQVACVGQGQVLIVETQVQIFALKHDEV